MKHLRRENYYDGSEWERIKQFSDSKETPFLVVDTKVIEKRFHEIQKSFSYAKIYYAVKANPAPEVITLLNKLGSYFDVASIYELNKIMDLGVSADKISFGNTIKKPRHVKEAYERGVRLFVTDSEADLRNIAKAAPGSRVFVRILTEGAATADWPLSRKFGCHTDMACDLLSLARKLGLDATGISFHVGSQQNDIGAWDSAIAKARYVFDWVEKEEGFKLNLINMGGGLPASYMTKTNDISVYAQEIERYLDEDFGSDRPEIIIEPGRYMVANAGVLVSEIVLISRKTRTSLNRWIYIDVGKFSGLIETIDESIKYPIYTEKTGELEDSIIAGPTCDGMDIMYENHQYDLPLNLAIGDRLYWFSAGAYTSSYSAVEFNGFPPLKTYFI